MNTEMVIIDLLRKLLKEEPSLDDINVYKQQLKDGTADVRCETCNKIINRLMFEKHCKTDKQHIRILDCGEEEVIREEEEKKRERREKKREYNKTYNRKYDKSGWQKYRSDLFYKFY